MFMIDLPLNAGELMRFARDQGHSIERDDDFGYASHAWLIALFGELAPKPFRLFERRGCLRLLGYCRHDIPDLRDYAATFAEPNAIRVCDLDSAAGKMMPEVWSIGRRLGFELRACPVSRSDRERDVFLVAIERSKKEGVDPPSRLDAYFKWLVQRMEASVTNGGPFVNLAGLEKEPIVELLPGSVSLGGFRRVRTRRGGNGAKARQKSVERPDALFTGQLIVRSPDGFHRLLERGIGRHRAFGFGMLLIRPPATAM